MGSYYYLMAQLPFLIYEQKPPMSSDAFKALAESNLGEEDLVYLEDLSLDPCSGQSKEGNAYAESAPSTGCDFLDGWREWERTLRLNLAKHRAIHLKRENVTNTEPPLMPQDAAGAAIKAVTGDGNALEGELLIDKARWNAIDSLAGIDMFDRNNVYAYFLKLLLLERREAFKTDKGFSEYQSLYAEIIESSQDSGHNSPGELK